VKLGVGLGGEFAGDRQRAIDVVQLVFVLIDLGAPCDQQRWVELDDFG
jgi:hypothetical protein